MLEANEILKQSLKDVYFSALVVDNKDPEEKGRIKIRLEKLHNEVSDDNLPWALPKINISGLDIPLKGKYVWVELQQSNEYEPVYYGYVLPKNVYSGTVMAEDYPNTRGFFDGTNWVSINLSSGKIQLHNESSEVTLDSSGITINSSGELNITITGACNITSSSQINLSAPIINCN